MKNINYLNYFAIGLPLAILVTYPIFKEGSLFFSVLSTMLTGLIQVILGLKMLLDEPKNKYLQIYITAVILFFCFAYASVYLDFFEQLKIVVLGLPVAIAIYLSVIIYNKRES